MTAILENQAEQKAHSGIAALSLVHLRLTTKRSPFVTRTSVIAKPTQVIPATTLI